LTEKLERQKLTNCYVLVITAQFAHRFAHSMLSDLWNPPSKEIKTIRVVGKFYTVESNINPKLPDPA